MKAAFLTVVLLLIPTAAFGANHAHISLRELVAAIRRADPVQLDGVIVTKLTASSVRVIRCVGPEEEPTELKCVWQTRGKRGWIKQKSWFAVDGQGWHFID